MEEVKHTAAADERRFEALPVDAKLKEIWLNGRETNGHVADALRDISKMNEWRTETVEPWMKSVDKRLIGAAAIIVFILTAAPFVFFILSQWKGE